MKKVRVRIEHCSILHDDQIARMKDLGVSASFLIGHVHYWGVAMRDEVFGQEKPNYWIAARALRRRALDSRFIPTSWSLIPYRCI
jgi:predicted amidohydrolase YtcJ